MSVHKVRYLRYACSQNGHLRNVNSHFSSYTSLDSEFSEPDTEFIDRFYLEFIHDVQSLAYAFSRFLPIELPAVCLLLLPLLNIELYFSKRKKLALCMRDHPCLVRLKHPLSPFSSGSFFTLLPIKIILLFLISPSSHGLPNSILLLDRTD